MKWQGRPFVVPLRHLRDHVGFSYLILCCFSQNGHYQVADTSSKSINFVCQFSDSTRCASYASKDMDLLRGHERNMAAAYTVHTHLSAAEGARYGDELRKLMDIADGEVPGKVLLHGKIYQEERWIFVPESCARKPTYQLALARSLAVGVLRMESVDGIRWGTSCTRLPPMPQCHYGVLIVWNRTNFVRHTVREIVPETGFNFRSKIGGSWSECLSCCSIATTSRTTTLSSRSSLFLISRTSRPSWTTPPAFGATCLSSIPCLRISPILTPTPTLT